MDFGLRINLDKKMPMLEPDSKSKFSCDFAMDLVRLWFCNVVKYPNARFVNVQVDVHTVHDHALYCKFNTFSKKSVYYFHQVHYEKKLKN